MIGAVLPLALLRNVDVALRHAALDLGGTAKCVHNARKLYKDSVARGLHDTAAVLLDLGID